MHKEIIKKLELSETQFDLLKQRYESLGSFLDERLEDKYSNIEVYAQGSAFQDTIIRTKLDDNTFDVDIVVQVTGDTNQISQLDFKKEIGSLLKEYSKENNMNHEPNEEKRS